MSRFSQTMSVSTAPISRHASVSFTPLVCLLVSWLISSKNLLISRFSCGRRPAKEPGASATRCDNRKEKKTVLPEDLMCMHWRSSCRWAATQGSCCSLEGVPVACKCSNSMPKAFLLQRQRQYATGTLFNKCTFVQ